MARPTTGARQAAYRRGLRQEALAAWWLRAKGYRILAQRYKTPYGEIDLIARRGCTLAFIEIKARATPEAAAHAISPHQQARIRQAAERFLQERPVLAACQMRFDAVFCCPGRWPQHVPGAWE
jgi:putative endonuclease